MKVFWCGGKAKPHMGPLATDKSRGGNVNSSHFLGLGLPQFSILLCHGETLKSAEASQCVLSLCLLDGVSEESERHPFLCCGSGQMSPGEEPSGHVHTDISGFLSVFFSYSLLLFVFFFFWGGFLHVPACNLCRQTGKQMRHTHRNNLSCC